MNKVYTIELKGEKIGTSLLEKADPPMGVVIGAISFLKEEFGYTYFSKYCRESGIKTEEYPDDKIISTFTIPELKVYDGKGNEIKGEGNYISGMDGDVFEINIVGIPYPLYEQEFPHHVREYEERFK